MHRMHLILPMLMLPIISGGFLLLTVEAKIIHVGGHGDGNYTSIQQAVNNASDGDVIYIYRGTYRENFIISSIKKNLKLMGEDRDETIIEGVENDSAIIDIMGENCSIENITIVNLAERASAVISVSYIDGAKIANCNVEGNGYQGIYLFFSRNVTISNNTIEGGGINIIGGVSIEYWNTHKIINNTLNGKRIYFLNGITDFHLNSVEAGQIIVVNCTNSRFENIEIYGAKCGFILAFSSDNFVENCHLHNNFYGLFIHKSRDNIIRNNVVENNTYGLYVTHSSYNTIYKNIIRWNENCGCSICCGSFYNTVYMNNFSMNTLNAKDEGIFNNWHYKNTGNFWSDYNGTDEDGDGIGDSPYIIQMSENKTVEDLYPIVDFRKIKTEDNKTPGLETSISILAFIVVLLNRIFSGRRRREG